MTLGELIKALESLDGRRVVAKGFGAPHSDRGDYSNVAFEPANNVTVGSMRKYAKGALGKTFTGYTGGDYRMSEYVDALIGNWGRCGEEITSLHIEYWAGRLA